jgi:multisubunit Na+/H+ antiporter MnhC subunit
VVVGLGYGALAVSILIVGAARQRRVAESLRRGGYDHLSDPLVVYMTAAAVVLAIATLALVVVAP